MCKRLIFISLLHKSNFTFRIKSVFVNSHSLHKCCPQSHRFWVNVQTWLNLQSVKGLSWCWWFQLRESSVLLDVTLKLIKFLELPDNHFSIHCDLTWQAAKYHTQPLTHPPLPLGWKTEWKKKGKPHGLRESQFDK